MNPLAIFQALKKRVESSPFSNSVSVEFGWEPRSLEASTRARVVVTPGDAGNTVGPATAYPPTTYAGYAAVQDWFTSLLIEVDDNSMDECSQWSATAALRNWVHAELVRILPAGRMVIMTQQYVRNQTRTNHVAIALVIRTSDWIEVNEDASIQEILATGQIQQTLLDEIDIYAVP